MYKLILTFEERQAIEWVGHRDWNGDDLYKILQDCQFAWYGNFPDYTIDYSPWETLYTLQYQIPEHKAWEIFQLWHEAGQTIPHFVPELVSKIQTLLDSIV